MKINFVLIIFFLLLNDSGVYSIKCYQCNSVNITGCGDPFTATNTLDDCPLLGGKEAFLCRKLKQLVDSPEGKIVRVLRSCGYISNEIKERDTSCFRASFTSAASSKYCSCIDSACNKVDKIQSSIFTMCLLLLTTFYVVIGF